MKTLTIEQMEFVYGGSLRQFLSCVSQVTGGIGTLAGIAAALAFTTTPIGLIILGLGALSLATGVASDPTACDS
jgi:hypothetical protein